MALALPQRCSTDSLPSQLLRECDQSSAPRGSRRGEPFALEMNTNSKCSDEANTLWFARGGEAESSLLTDGGRINPPGCLSEFRHQQPTCFMKLITLIH